MSVVALAAIGLTVFVGSLVSGVFGIAGGMIRVVPGSGLGILADEGHSSYAAPIPIEQLPEGVRERATSGDLLLVSKTNAVAPVHRRERMDEGRAPRALSAALKDLRHAGENFCDMQYASVAISAPAQPAFDIQHAAEISQHECVGINRLHVFAF